MADIGEILGAFGVTPEITLAAAAAISDPTSNNVNAVVSAYAANGQVVPAKLYAYLIQINEEQHPEDTVRSTMTPWLIAGGLAAVYFIFFARKHGR